MKCEHPWIISVIVEHWSGSYIQYHCCLCGTGMGREKTRSSKKLPFMGNEKHTKRFDFRKVQSSLGKVKK